MPIEALDQFFGDISPSEIGQLSEEEIADLELLARQAIENGPNAIGNSSRPPLRLFGGEPDDDQMSSPSNHSEESSRCSTCGEVLEHYTRCPWCGYC